MRYKLTLILFLFSLTLSAQLTDEDLKLGPRLREPKELVNNGWLKEKMQDLNERAHSGLTGGISMSPQQYEDTIRAFFRADRWHDAYPFLQAAEREWEGNSVICCLFGRYWFHEKSYDVARRYLLMAVADDDSNTEALETLVKIEEILGNYPTAIVHVNDLLSWSPYNRRLWRKKIELYRLSGNDVEADRLLERLITIYPNDEQIRKDVIYRKELKYIQLSKTGNEKESQEAIHELIMRNPKDAQYYIALSGSLLKEGKNDEALEVCAKGVNNTHGNRTLIRRRVSILADMARYQEAEQYLDDCIRRYGTNGLEQLRDYLREQAAYAADAADAYTRHQRLYALTDSDDALDWLINASMQRGWWDDADYYLRQAQNNRGQSKDLLLRQYTVQKRLGNNRAADRLLEDLYLADTADTDIRERLAEKRLAEANDLMRDEQWAEALIPLCQADSLTADSDFHALLARKMATCHALKPDTTVVKDSLDWLQHSVIYESQHNLDSAYVAIMRYRPSLEEYHDVMRHRYTLQSRVLKNTLAFEYQYARRASIDQWTHNAYLTYTRAFTRNAFDASVAYAGRESSSWKETDEQTGLDSTFFTRGGTGIQLGAAYYHFFAWGDLSIQAAWASKFFPVASVKLGASQNLPMDWTLSERLQWRFINDNNRYHIFSAGASAAWSSSNGFLLTPSLDLYLIPSLNSSSSPLSFNAGFKMTYFPLDGDRSHIFAAVSAGNAPDLSLLDNSMPVSFSTLNTSVSAGGTYLINGHLALSASVDWYVIGSNASNASNSSNSSNPSNPSNATIRNFFYLHAGLTIFF